MTKVTKGKVGKEGKEGKGNWPFMRKLDGIFHPSHTQRFMRWVHRNCLRTAHMQAARLRDYATRHAPELFGKPGTKMDNLAFCLYEVMTRRGVYYIMPRDQRSVYEELSHVLRPWTGGNEDDADEDYGIPCPEDMESFRKLVVEGKLTPLGEELCALCTDIACNVCDDASIEFDPAVEWSFLWEEDVEGYPSPSTPSSPEYCPDTPMYE